MDYKRYKFLEIFQEFPDGSLVAKMPLQVGEISFPSGTTFQKGVVYGGIDFNLYKGKDIAVISEESSEGENSQGPLRIAGFYPG